MRQKEFGFFGYLAQFHSGRRIALLSHNFLFLAKVSGSIARMLADIITGHYTNDSSEHLKPHPNTRIRPMSISQISSSFSRPK